MIIIYIFITPPPPPPPYPRYQISYNIFLFVKVLLFVKVRWGLWQRCFSTGANTVADISNTAAASFVDPAVALGRIFFDLAG